MNRNRKYCSANMLHIVFFLLHISIMLCCSLQQGRAQTLWLRGGLGFSGMTASNVDAEYYIDFHEDIVPSFGAMLDIPLESTFSIETGILLNRKEFLKAGSRTFIFIDTIRYEFDAYYIEIPLLLKPKVAIDSTWRFFGVFGGYVSFGLRGTYNALSRASYMGAVGVFAEKGQLRWTWDGEGDVGVNRAYEIGHTLGIGFETKRIQLSVTFSRGMTGFITSDGIQQSLLLFNFAVMIPTQKQNAPKGDDNDTGYSDEIN